MTRSAPERLRRRDRMRRALFWIAVGAALVLALVLVQCGGGFGLGGGGGSGVGGGRRAIGTSDGSGAAIPRCALRVDATGIALDDRAVSIADAVAACHRAGGAEVLVTGDARQGTWDALRAALDAAAIAFHTRGAGAPPDAGR